MDPQSSAPNTDEPDASRLNRIGGISALIFGIAYIVIIALYVPMGAPPTGAEARLQYHADNTTLWWAIIGLSVLTDLLLVPVAFALYFALRRINRDKLLIGLAFVALFAILDLAVTWTNYAALVTLSTQFAAATGAERAALVTAAAYPTVVLESNLLFVYNTLTLSIGILLVGIVMLRGVFDRATAYVGVATGVLGILAVAGPLLISALSVTIIVASLLTTIWMLLVGYRLLRLGTH